MDKAEAIKSLKNAQVFAACAGIIALAGGFGVQSYGYAAVAYAMVGGGFTMLGFALGAWKALGEWLKYG